MLRGVSEPRRLGKLILMRMLDLIEAKGKLTRHPGFQVGVGDWDLVLVSSAMGQLRKELLWEGKAEAEVPESARRSAKGSVRSTGGGRGTGLGWKVRDRAR